MRLSDIEVGAEYVVGQASYARRRVRVLSIGHPDDHYRGGGRTGELIAGSPRMPDASWWVSYDDGESWRALPGVAPPPIREWTTGPFPPIRTEA